MLYIPSILPEQMVSEERRNIFKDGKKAASHQMALRVLITRGSSLDTQGSLRCHAGNMRDGGRGVGELLLVHV